MATRTITRTATPNTPSAGTDPLNDPAGDPPAGTDQGADAGGDSPAGADQGTDPATAAPTVIPMDIAVGQLVEPTPAAVRLYCAALVAQGLIAQSPWGMTPSPGELATKAWDTVQALEAEALKRPAAA